jgi:catechol 2,3-dioxygenase-like lactoylglutathione lyase family enzyme
MELQHINIRCADVESSRRFYECLGLAVGSRPPFTSRGYWLYAGTIPVVHLVQRPNGEAVAGPGTGNLDHVAFEGKDLASTRRMLNSQGITFREALVPRDGVTQLFVADPDGITLELNFAP